MTDDDTITAEDVAVLNRQAVARAGAFVRNCGSVLMGIGALGAAGWLWVTVREQQLMDDGSDDPFGSGGGADVDLVDRIDAFTGTLILLLVAALAVAIGLALRLIADYAVARLGGTLTRFEAGDPAPPPGPGEPGETSEPGVTGEPGGTGDDEPGGTGGTGGT